MHFNRVHPSTFFQSCSCNVINTLLLHWILGVITISFTLKVFKATIVLIRAVTVWKYIVSTQEIVSWSKIRVYHTHESRILIEINPLFLIPAVIYMMMHNVSLCKWSNVGACLCFSVFPQGAVIPNITVDLAGVVHNKDNTCFIGHKWTVYKSHPHSPTHQYSFIFSISKLDVLFFTLRPFCGCSIDKKLPVDTGAINKTC